MVPGSEKLAPGTRNSTRELHVGSREIHVSSREPNVQHADQLSYISACLQVPLKRPTRLQVPLLRTRGRLPGPSLLNAPSKHRSSARAVARLSEKGPEHFKDPAGNLRLRIGFGAKAEPSQAQKIRHGTHIPAHNDSKRFWVDFGLFRRRRRSTTFKL